MVGAGEVEFSCDFVLLGSVESDAVGGGCSWLKHADVLEVNEALGTDVASGHVLIHDGDVEPGGAVGASWDVDVNGFVPDDGLLLRSGNNFGSVLLGSAVGGQLEDDVVLHLADDIVALVEESVGDVEAEV